MGLLLELLPSEHVVPAEAAVIVVVCYYYCSHDDCRLVAAVGELPGVQRAYCFAEVLTWWYFH